MARLTEVERETIFLEHQEGSSISAIAKSLDRSYQVVRGAVRSQWYAAMEAGTYEVLTEADEDSQVTIEEAIEAVEDQEPQIDPEAEALLREVEEEIEEEYEEDFDYEEEE